MIPNQAERYELEVGRLSRLRQEELLATRFACCGEHKDDGHHEACSKAPKTRPREHADQVSLI